MRQTRLKASWVASPILNMVDKARAIEIAEANNDFQTSDLRLRKQIIKIQDTEDEISAQCSNTKLRWTS